MAKPKCFGQIAMSEKTAWDCWNCGVLRKCVNDRNRQMNKFWNEQEKLKKKAGTVFADGIKWKSRMHNHAECPQCSEMVCLYYEKADKKIFLAGTCSECGYNIALKTAHGNGEMKRMIKLLSKVRM